MLPADRRVNPKNKTPQGGNSAGFLYLILCTRKDKSLFDFNILKAWCEMLKLIAESVTAKRFMWLTYAVGIAALIIWRLPDILAVVLK